jgi:hypothetical protein
MGESMDYSEFFRIRTDAALNDAYGYPVFAQLR